MRILDNIPQGRLVNLIGSEVCAALSNYSDTFESNSIDYKEVLLARYGQSFLLEKDVYQTVMQWIDAEQALQICNSVGLFGASIENAQEKLQKTNLGSKNEEFLMKFAAACELDPECYRKSSDAAVIESIQRLEPSSPLHDFQKRIKDEIVKGILSSDQKVALLAHMPTGSGKTRTCMEALVDFHRSKPALGGHDHSGFTVWLAHSKELCEQASDTFEFLWKQRGDAPLSVVRLYGNSSYEEEMLVSDDAIVFASFQKFNAMRKSSHSLQSRLTQKILQKTRLVVVDEAHRSLATTYEDAISFLSDQPGTRLIGLTATPGRSVDLDDPENEYLSGFFGGKKVGLEDEVGVPLENPISYLQERKFLAEVDRVELKTNCDLVINTEEGIKGLQQNGDDYVTKISSSLALDASRNHILITEIRKAYELEESILVFTCSVEHCVILETLLSKAGIVAESVLGDTPKSDRESRIERFRNKELKVLLNYGVLSTGFDAPCLNTLIIARPIASIVLFSQIIGRALRGPRNGGNEKNRVVDLIDNIVIMGNVSKQFSHFDRIWS